MEQLLIQLGVSVTSNAIYDFLKSEFHKNSALSKQQLQDDLESFLNIEGADIAADKIITFLAGNGDIQIIGTTIYAQDSISFSSARNTKFIIGNNSSSKTKSSIIEAGPGAFIEGQGGAGMKQNEDGSISFFA